MSESQTASLILRTRRNHALEHATIAVLFEREGNSGGIAALSDPWGFGILSGFDTDIVEQAAEEALQRLRAGQVSLAITDLCGSNLIVTGALAAVAVMAAGRGKWRNLPSAISAAALATIAAKPLGRWVQQTLTTDTTGMHSLRIQSVHGRRLSETRSVARVNIAGRG